MALRRLSLVGEAASTRRMWARGAMAWAHSTSREISKAQPGSVGGGRRVVALVRTKSPLASVVGR